MEESKNFTESSKPVVTNLWDESDSEETSGRKKQSDNSDEADNQTSTFMVVK